MNGNSFSVHKYVIVELFIPSGCIIKSLQTSTRYEVGYICQLHMCISNIVNIQPTKKNLLLKYFLREKGMSGVPFALAPWSQGCAEHCKVNTLPNLCMAAVSINPLHPSTSLARTSHFCHFFKLSFHFYPQKWLKADTTVYTAVWYSRH